MSGPPSSNLTPSTCDTPVSCRFEFDPGVAVCDQLRRRGPRVERPRDAGELAQGVVQRRWRHPPRSVHLTGSWVRRGSSKAMSGVPPLVHASVKQVCVEVRADLASFAVALRAFRRLVSALIGPGRCTWRRTRRSRRRTSAGTTICARSSGRRAGRQGTVREI